MSSQHTEHAFETAIEHHLTTQGGYVTADPHDFDKGRGPFYAVRSDAFLLQLEAGATGATIRGIDIFDLKRGPIAVPPHDEQDKIAMHLDRSSRQLETLLGKVRQSIDSLREYRTALISAAVTGKINVGKEII